MPTHSARFLWIVKYIAEYHTTTSRYELDQKLLAKGYAAEEIERAWQGVLSGQYKAWLPEKPPLFRNPLKLRQFRYGCLYPLIGLLIVMGLLVLLILLLKRPVVLPEPLPAYPGATWFVSTGKLPQYSSSPECDGDSAAFEDEDLTAYTTSAPVADVLDFYRKAAKAKGLDETCPLSYGSSGSSSNGFSGSPSNSWVFSQYSPGGFLNTQVGAQRIVVLDCNDSQQAAFIRANFPDAPANSNLIFLVRGILERTLG